MKIVRFEAEGVVRYGAIEGDDVFPFSGQTALPAKSSTLNREAARAVKDARLLCPVAPSKIVCVGRNYAAHAAELGNEVPQFPLLFLKAPSSLIADGEPIRIPKASERVEHEGELGVVIGRDCSGLADADNPFDYVLGYVCLNDVTARDIQKREVQFTRAKSFDTFCPVGATIETDLDPSDIRVTTRVNGEYRQDGRTGQMVFPVEFLLRYISNQMTLRAGDLIATGTPAGVSQLKSGDVCEIEIEGVGKLSNPVA